MQQETSTTTSGKKSNGKWHASEGASGPMESARQAYDTVVDKASDYISDLRANPTRLVRQYPVQAALGGVVIGFLLGAVVCRRS
jgi:hypothetical protein